jgi:hypothetical protein
MWYQKTQNLMPSFAAFSTNSKSASNSAFLVPHITFLKEKKLDHINTFYILCLQMRTKRLKTTDIFFFYVSLELNFATINGVGEPSCKNRCTLLDSPFIKQRNNF